MRLLYIVPDPDRIGGLARSIGRVTHALRGLGHEVEVFFPGAGDPPQNTQQELVGLLYGTTIQRWVDLTLEEIERVQPDLLVGYYGSRGAYCAVAAARLTGHPVVACLRGNDVNRDFFSAPYGRRLEFAVKYADTVTVVSQEMRHKIERWLGGTATVISNSVDTGLFRPDPEGALRLRREWEIGDGPVAGLFGEFKAAKGLGTLDALEEPLRQAHATTLLIGEVREENRHEVPAWVRRIPYIADHETLCAAYSLCDLVLQPSVHEGMPNTVLEAMACERVVVASRTGGLIDLIQDGRNGFLCGREDWPRVVGQLLAAPPAGVGAAARRGVPVPAGEAAAFGAVFADILERRQAGA